MQRREVHLNSVADLRREVEIISTLPVRTVGNWNAAQILQHVARLMELAYSGFGFRAPWYVRPIARLMLPRVLKRGFKPGFTLPERARALLPDDDVTLPAAAAQVDAVLNRMEQGEPMTHPSPLYGRLTPEQWVQLHLRHAEHHFSFVVLLETAA